MDGYRRGALGLAAAVVVVLRVLTWRQAGIYRDEITFFSHVVAHNPEARDAHLNLASALFEADRFTRRGSPISLHRGAGWRQPNQMPRYLVNQNSPM